VFTRKKGVQQGSHRWGEKEAFLGGGGGFTNGRTKKEGVDITRLSEGGRVGSDYGKGEGYCRGRLCQVFAYSKGK